MEYTDGESTVIHLTECNYGKIENINVNNMQLFTAMFADIYGNFDCTDKVNFAKSGVYNILQTLKDMASGKAKDEIADKCAAYIDVNFDKSDMKITYICRSVNVSESPLLRKFCKVYGVSPKQYLMKKRLNKAVKC